MKVVVTYPMPLSISDGYRWGPAPTLQDFKEIAGRFVATYKEFPPDYEHRLLVICCQGEADQSVRAIFDGLPCEFVKYCGPGWDIAADQFVARQQDCDFVVT